MLFHAESARLALADDQVVQLTDACDSRLVATEGFVWVTLDGDRGDVVLRPGESYVVDSADVVTVSALRGAAAVEVRAHAGGGRCRRATATRLVHRPTRLERLLTGVTISSAAVA